MAVKVMIPTPLRAYAGKQESVEVQAATVGEALSALTSKFGELKKHLYSDDGRLRSFVNVYVNDEDIRYLQKDQTPAERRRHGQHRALDRRRRRHRTRSSASTTENFPMATKLDIPAATAGHQHSLPRRSRKKKSCATAAT